MIKVNTLSSVSIAPDCMSEYVNTAAVTSPPTYASFALFYCLLSFTKIFSKKFKSFKNRVYYCTMILDPSFDQLRCNNTTKQIRAITAAAFLAVTLCASLMATVQYLPPVIFVTLHLHNRSVYVCKCIGVCMGYRACVWDGLLWWFSQTFPVFYLYCFVFL